MGPALEKNVLQPTYRAINDKITELQKIKITIDDEGIENKIEEIKDNVEEIKTLLGKLKKNGLYDEPETEVVRDHIAEAIRAKVIEIHNQGGLYEEAEKLIKVAASIAGTESYKGELEGDKGKIGKSIEMDKNSIVSVKISGFLSSKFAEFKPRVVEYEGKKLFYKDITHITYNGISRNGYTTYYFTISDGSEQVSLTFSDLTTYQKLVGLAYQLIMPRIVKRYIDSIFDEDEPITIGEVEISKRGYTRQKFFGGTDSVSWKEKIFIPQLFAGNVILYKENDAGRGMAFSRIPMTTWNAVVLPMLIKECVNKAFALGIIKGASKVNVQQPVRPIVTGTGPVKTTSTGGLSISSAAKKVGEDSWLSYSGAKYYMIKNKKTGKWDICSNNNNNPPLDGQVWAGDFNSKEEAEVYLKETLQDIKRSVEQ